MNVWLTNDPGQNGYPYKPAKIQEIKEPANTILLTDAWHKGDPTLPKGRVTGTFFIRGYYNNGIDDVALWHQGSTNVLWVDGHVSRVKSPNSKSDAAIYDAAALGNYSLANNMWDRK